MVAAHHRLTTSSHGLYGSRLTVLYKSSEGRDGGGEGGCRTQGAGREGQRRGCLDSISEATTAATVWVSKGNNESTDESVTFGGAMLAGDVLFLFCRSSWKDSLSQRMWGLDDFSLSALRHVLSPLLSCRIEYIFFAASGRRR
jgi:hypothetical protein